MIHLYAVVDGLAGLPPVRGLEDAPLEQLQVDDLDVVVSSAAPAPVEPSEEDVIRHALVVEELLARSEAVLPARLGQGFADASELAEAVRADADRLRTALRRVQGSVEFGLRVLRPPDERPRVLPLTGTEYLRARLAEENELERMAADLHEPLAELARASTRRQGQNREQLFDAAYLVPLDAVERFRDRLARLESSRPELSFFCTGPWPPYSFTAGGEDPS